MREKYSGILLLLFLTLGFSNLFSQLKYYEAQFKGGVTGAGYSPAYDDGGTGLFTINIPPGSTIHKAYLFASRYGMAPAVTVTLNGTNLVFDMPSQVTNTFQSAYYGGNSAVHALDLTATLNPATQNYTLVIPTTQSSTSDRYQDFYLYVAYDNPGLNTVNTAVFLDTLNIIDSIPMNIHPTLPIPNTTDVGVALFCGYMCDSVSDGEYVWINNTQISKTKIGGPDVNSGSCGGPIGSFYYKNGTLTGLSDDNADLKVAGGECLSNVRSVIANNTPNFYVNFEKNTGKVQ